MLKGKKIEENKHILQKCYTAINLPQNSLNYKKETAYFVKDNFWTKEFITTASSEFLTNFLPGQNSFVVNLLQSKKKFLLGKTVLDEFACGGTGLYAHTGPVFNPYNSSRIAGGSSSGSAWAVAKGLVPFALGHDTGDSIRRPASYCGIIGFKPSYGVISRSGVIPMASSLDTIGIFAKEIQNISGIFNIAKKSDSHDLLTQTKKDKLPIAFSKKKVAIIAGLEKNLSKELVNLYHNTITKLEKLGYSIEKIIIPKTIREHLQITYLILCSTELVSHLNSLQGVTYGVKGNNSVIQKRSKNLGEIVKQRLLIGSYFLDDKKLWEKAQKMRYLVGKWTKKVFHDYDFLVFPSTNNTPPPVNDFNHSFSGLISSHWSDNLLLLANFSGLPSLSLPIGFVSSLPVSININSSYGSDQKVLELATELEEKNKYKS